MSNEPKQPSAWALERAKELDLDFGLWDLAQIEIYVALALDAAREEGQKEKDNVVEDNFTELHMEVAHLKDQLTEANNRYDNLREKIAAWELSKIYRGPIPMPGGGE